MDNRFFISFFWSKQNSPRLCLDSEGNSLVVWDWQYPGDPNGRCFLFSSHKILQWLGERHQGGLQTVSRLSNFVVFMNIALNHHHHQNHHNNPHNHQVYSNSSRSRPGDTSTKGHSADSYPCLLLKKCTGSRTCIFVKYNIDKTHSKLKIVSFIFAFF